MKTSSVMRSSTLYLSDVMPLVVSEDGADGEIIAWADARPVVYKIVTEAKSAAFGRQSTQWHGWAQGENTPRAILHRLGVFRRMLDDRRRRGFDGDRSGRGVDDGGDNRFNRGGDFACHQPSPLRRDGALA